MTLTGAATLQGFIPLADYAHPALPAQELVRTLVGRVQALLARGTPKPFIADDRLKKATMDRLDEVVAPPACGPLLDELDQTVATWRQEAPRTSHIKVVVLPPCDENAVIEAWATRSNHRIVQPPARDQLLERLPPPTLPSGALLVIPRLEDWFLRHRNGLHQLRGLLAAIDAADSLVVIGCNSWAWAFVSKAAGADMLLPEAVTFLAFDEMRLHHWFSQLATADTTGCVRFRRAQSGAEVLELGDDGTPGDDYLRTLAGRSLGIPWVAWHMWRRSLRAEGDTPVAEDAKALVLPDAGDGPGEETLWVAALDEYVLPGKDEPAALLVLQALLIHGALAAGHLALVLPLVGDPGIVTVLVRSGFVECTDGLFRCRTAAYPAIRAGLASAGLPLGRF